VVDLAAFDLGNRSSPEVIYGTLKRELGEVTPTQAKLAASKVQLNHSGRCASYQQQPHKAFGLPANTPPIPRTNTIIINGLPTGASDDRGPYSPAECHEALLATNHATLTITQLPSWVRSPSSYTPGTTSSLSLSFEDPNGSKLKALLTERYLYDFGTRATVKKWKHHQHVLKDSSKCKTLSLSKKTKRMSRPFSTNPPLPHPLPSYMLANPSGPPTKPV